MPSTKPVKNAISSASEFKTLCVTVSKSYKIRVSDEAIRHLRLTMNTSVASAALLPEAIDVIISSLANQTSGVTVSTTTDEKLEGEKQHYVRKLLNWKRQNRKRITWWTGNQRGSLVNILTRRLSLPSRKSAAFSFARPSSKTKLRKTTR
ncbi:hypothetical protein PC129_g23334 [Phytophthora cactorum]|uniref:Uncharacterized protein n=1 Tax=Phytophthora cactorum TaxID=29920 RepID=A0A8T0Y9E3_9STRA|nr:hypothetical protein PC111_g23935 [Phytophthora cactorum]KAG2805248.1 hypothetical protein PC112_g18351 [Phytophthora cactorum]KAG2819337.1 hypothetical protein PC113_g22741 [Phytophthora cactorum]KAG2874024.1 hypothetical protein PC114_g25525 [Phytophthora cactorum]KAG2875056.1 hypothetical protein PC115_g24013 [Phytophthora cactorum]